MPASMHSITRKLACDGYTGIFMPATFETALRISAWLRRWRRLMAGNQLSLTFSPAIAARWEITLEPRLLGGAAASISINSGLATVAPTRRPASPSHLEKL